MGGRLCPRVPSHTMLCGQLCPAALSQFPVNLGCPTARSWKLGGTLQRDRTNVSLLWGLGWLAGAVMGEKQTGRWQWAVGQSSVGSSACGDMALHGPAHVWCLLYCKRLCSVVACSVAGAVLPRMEFLRPFPQLELGQNPAMEQIQTFLPCVSNSFASTGLCGTWGQRSSSALSLPSRNTLPNVSWQLACLAQQSTAGADPWGCVSPRAPEPPPAGRSWLSGVFITAPARGSRHREPQACAGRWVEGP